MLCTNYLRAYLIAGLSSIGGLLIGYHAGVISGVLTMGNFQETMEIQTANTTIFTGLILNNKIGLIVAILLLGCVFGSLIGGQTSDLFSRRYSISAFAFFLTISTAIQINSSGLLLILIGRFLSGISMGALSMIIPVYHAEIAATDIRGRIFAIQHCAVTIGILISTWINVGMQQVYKDLPLEWQLPLGLQMVPSLILAIAVLFCPFSPRWLISRDRLDEARDVLKKIRSVSCDKIEEEIERIKAEVAYLREHEIESYRQLFHRPLRHPFLLGVGIQILQQLTGVSAAICYTPQVFVGIYSNDTSMFPNISDSLPLIMTAIYGSVYFLAAIPPIYYIVKLRQRIPLIAGSIIMAISLSVAGILIPTFGSKAYDHWKHTPIYNIYDSNLLIVLIASMFTYIIGFALSWGPIPWGYCTEIFPVTMRAKATSLTTAVNWATNCIVTYVTPFLLVYLPYGIYLLFGGFCFLMGIIVFVFYQNTTHTPLEETEIVNGYHIFVPRILTNVSNTDEQKSIG